MTETTTTLTTAELRDVAEWMRDEGILNADRVDGTLHTYTEERVTAALLYVDHNGPGSLSDLDEAYGGAWRTLAEWAEELVTDIGYVPADLPSWIVLDWSATASNLLADYWHEDVDGTVYVFRRDV